MNTNKPTPIPVKGVDIRSTVIDESEDVVKHTLIIFMDQFKQFAESYVDHRGVLRLEIVKRRTISSKGHDHWLRVASSKTNPCYTDGVIPKPNELK